MMTYELTESPWYPHCEDIFRPIRYNESGECLGISLTESRLPDVQRFFGVVMGHESVEKILFILEFVDGSRKKYEDYNIRAGEFCETLSLAHKKTPFPGIDIPAVKIFITK